MIYLIGIITGLITGLALGGGAVLIPFLVFFLNVDQHTAQGVTLASFLPLSIVAVVTHFYQGNVLIKIALRVILGSLPGAVAGALLAMKFSPDILQKIYGGFLLLMGIYEYVSATKTMDNKPNN